MKNRTFLTIIFLSIVLAAGCSTPVREDDTAIAEEAESSGLFSKDLPNPSGTDEPVYNEKRKKVSINDSDPEFFKKPSTNENEFFRVIITSDSYELRQIRGSGEIMRKKDTGGDKNISGHVTRFDKIDFKDEGTIEIIVNPVKKHILALNFRHRAPRINDLAEIMRDDASRWEFDYKKDDVAKFSFEVSYQIRLSNKTSRDKIKEELKQEIAR